VDKRFHRLSSDDRTLLFGRIAGMLEGQPDVLFAYAFGSSVTEPAFHDVDVAVYLSDSVGDPRSRALELAEDLERDLELPVDVQPLNGAPTSFAFHAVRGRLLFSRDDTQLAATIEETVRSYLDVAPFVRQATREAFAR
jgi:predicted nucleotidyltransferase